ncbi:uncharacterized protein LOC144443581 [Glandiceps talaboti]
MSILNNWKEQFGKFNQKLDQGHALAQKLPNQKFSFKKPVATTKSRHSLKKKTEVQCSLTPWLQTPKENELERNSAITSTKKPQATVSPLPAISRSQKKDSMFSGLLLTPQNNNSVVDFEDDDFTDDSLFLPTGCLTGTRTSTPATTNATTGNGSGVNEPRKKTECLSSPIDLLSDSDSEEEEELPPFNLYSNQVLQEDNEKKSSYQHTIYPPISTSITNNAMGTGPELPANVSSVPRDELQGIGVHPAMSPLVEQVERLPFAH